MRQETFTDIEYSFRKRKAKREEFLEIMDDIIPWDEWVGVTERNPESLGNTGFRGFLLLFTMLL